MNDTILSKQQSELLGDLIAKYGQIVTFDEILAVTKERLDYQNTKNLVTRLVKNGWLIRLKRGLYAISELSNRGFLALSPYLVANLLVKDSYVSFEAALQYHSMFDQSLARVASVSLKMQKAVKLDNTEYVFVKTKPDYYFGWQEVIMDNKPAHIADAEKALIDMINFHRTKYTVDVVLEKLSEHKQDLDFQRFNEYLQKFPTITIKVFGFLFDLIGIDSTRLLEIVKEKRKYGAHWMLFKDLKSEEKASNKFNAKWRLYYDEYFDKYQNQ
jgi:predicted transcriptional regulator of viral defense system